MTVPSLPFAKTGMAFVNAPCHAISTLPFPAENRSDGSLILFTGITAQVSSPGLDNAQFACKSTAQLVVGHCSVGEGRSYAQIAELAHEGGRVTQVCICGDVRPYQGISACVLSGSAGGSVNAFRVDVPQHSGATPDEVVIHGTETQAATGAQLHEGTVTAVTYLAHSQQLLTAGEDGSLTIQRVDSGFQGPDPARCTIVAQANPFRSFADACWLGPDQILSVATGGCVQVWDARASSSPVRESPQDWVASAVKRSTHADAHSAAVPASSMRSSLTSAASCAALPSVPHACAIGHKLRGGSTAAVMTTWDLRAMHEPQVVPLGDHVAGAAGSVLLRPDPLRAGATAVPLVAATTGGHLLEVDLGRGAGVEVSELCRVNGSWVDVHADVSTGRMVVGCTSQQSVGIVERGLSIEAGRSGFGLLQNTMQQAVA